MNQRNTEVHIYLCGYLCVCVCVRACVCMYVCVFVCVLVGGYPIYIIKFSSSLIFTDFANRMDSRNFVR